MKQLIPTAVVILCISASIWFISKSINSSVKKQSVAVNHDIIHSKLGQPTTLPSSNHQKLRIVKTPVTSLQESIHALLLKQYFSAAIETFNNAYDELSESTIQNIQANFHQTAQQYLDQNQASLAKQLMAEYLLIIQDEQAYIILARAHVMQKEYRAAIDASVSAYGLADDLRQKRIEQYIINIALNYFSDEQKNYRKQDIAEHALYSNGNFTEVLQVLTQLHYLFPENAQLTFETANLLAATGDLSTAQQYFSALAYANNDYSQAAKNRLNAIVQPQRQPQKKQPEPSNNPPNQPTNNTPRKGIVVALKRSGSSYLVDAFINQSPVTLLLDTGASITALSEELVNRLNLDKTNQRVRLSTANGTRTSHIYHANSLQLSRITLNKVAIVEIALDRKSRIDGLLGTDVLQQFNYQIDNRTNSLILNPR